MPVHVTENAAECDPIRVTRRSSSSAGGIDVHALPDVALQPGAGAYTSPLSVHVTVALQDVLRTIHDTLDTLCQPNLYNADKAKFDVATYFTSGFAQYDIRVWKRCLTSTDSYAIEIMRKRGDRIFVTRFFEFLKAAFAGKKPVFNVAEFDWQPRELPPDILARLPIPSHEDVAAGIASMRSMVLSRYDDVAVNGCSSVAKLAAASSRTQLNFARSRLVVDVFAVAAALFGLLSMDTRSNAALAMSVLMQCPDALHVFVTTNAVSNPDNDVDADAATVFTVDEAKTRLRILQTLCLPHPEFADYETLCLRTNRYLLRYTLYVYTFMTLLYACCRGCFVFLSRSASSV